VRRSLAFFASFLLCATLHAQQQPVSLSPVSPAVPGGLVVLYRNHIMPTNADESPLRPERNPSIIFAASACLP